MRPRRIAQAVSAVAAACLLGIASSGSASATVYYADLGDIQAQLDTNPGNGKASWVWAYNPTDNYAYVEWEYYGASGNNYDYKWTIPPHRTGTANADREIWRIRVCTQYTGVNGQVYYNCTNWT